MSEASDARGQSEKNFRKFLITLTLVILALIVFVGLVAFLGLGTPWFE